MHRDAEWHNALVQQIREAQAAVDESGDALMRVIATARDLGFTWDQIGDALGCSRQNAHKRFA